jgi:hypothetical protein
MKRKIIQFLGFLLLRTCLYLVLAVLLLFLYDIIRKGGGVISWVSSRPSSAPSW